MTAASDVVLTQIEMTCNGCPSQWEATDAEGNDYYVRFRWGCLRVVRNGVCGPPIDEGEVIYNEQVSDEYDGIMDTPTMLEHTGMTVAVGRDRP